MQLPPGAVQPDPKNPGCKRIGGWWCDATGQWHPTLGLEVVIHVCWLPFICAEHLNCHLRPGGGRTRARSRGQGATNMAWQSAARHCVLFLSNVGLLFDCSTNCLERCNSDGGDVFVSGEAGGSLDLGEGWFLLPASMLPCWRFCQFRAHCFKFFFIYSCCRQGSASSSARGSEGR